MAQAQQAQQGLRAQLALQAPQEQVLLEQRGPLGLLGLRARQEQRAHVRQARRALLGQRAPTALQGPQALRAPQGLQELLAAVLRGPLGLLGLRGPRAR